MPSVTASETAEDFIEAVIISGPRKGQFITIKDVDEVITTEEQALLDQAVAAAWQMAESARGTRLAAEELRREFQESVEKLDELLGETR